jgi:ABC-2 type transport system permease protein
MSMRRLLAMTRRVLLQLLHDPRTLALLFISPALLMTILKYVYWSNPDLFQRVAGSMLGVFPMLMMFLITSVATLRERTSGTLERLMISPLGKAEFIGGYAIAFGLASLVQATAVSSYAIWVLGLKIAGPQITLIYAAILDALIGLALGLAVSTFAKTEFQAIQFMPAILLPQLLLSGLLVPRIAMPRILNDISNYLPLSYATDATKKVISAQGSILHDSLLIALFLAIILAAGSLTLKRQTK